MTTFIYSDLEPVARLRSAIPESCQPMLDQLLGMVPQPPDQPSCATATATLAKCLLDYAETIANPRPFFLEWAGTAQCIHESVSNHTQDIQGMVPSAPLTGRLAEFPALALLLALKEEHLPLRVALGAEVARCLLEQTELKQDYCVALRRDTVRYGRPQPGEVRTPEDLAELGFGRGWLVRFHKTDAQVRRRVELDELGPRRPPHAHPHHVLDLLARLRWRLDYPNPKHRHHIHFTRYSAALISFCAGLREVQCYRLLAEELLYGQDQIVVHDKQGGDVLMAQPALLNAQVREQIRLYAAHARALVRRLQRLNDRHGLLLAQRLRIAIEGTGPLFLTLSPSGAVHAAGAHFTWREMPESIRVPPNVGRHFWQNVLRERGLSSRDIDSFMRHRVVGLERNTNSQVCVPHQARGRIEATQLAVMREVGIQALAGLRKE